MHRRIQTHALWRGLRGFALLLTGLCWLAGALAREPDERVAVLVYHRFATTVADSMTVRVSTFEAQLRYLRDHGYHIVALRDVVAWLTDPRAALPPKAIALTADDGHRSIFEVLRPIAVRDRLKFTLFIYPSAISNAPYALTWAQLRALRETGLFDVQSHTYWHPNFNIERKRRTPEDFRRYAEKQFVESRKRIEAETEAPVDMLAWPFGIFDVELMSLASSGGYRAAFTIEGRTIDRRSPLLALPRFLITDADTPAALARRLDDNHDAMPGTASRPATVADRRANGDALVSRLTPVNTFAP